MQAHISIYIFPVTANSPINKMNIGAQSNVQTSMAPNQAGIQNSIAQVPQTSQAVTSSSQVKFVKVSFSPAFTILCSTTRYTMKSFFVVKFSVFEIFRRSESLA